MRGAFIAHPMTRFPLIRVIEACAALILGVLVVAVFVNVVLRFFFNSGFVVTEELSRILLIWLVFGGAIAVLHSGRHIKMTMLVEKLGPRGQLVLAVVGGLLMIFCDALLLMGAWRQLGFAIGDSFPVSGLPGGIVYAPGLIAAGAFILITTTKIVGLLRGSLTPQDYFDLTQDR